MTKHTPEGMTSLIDIKKSRSMWSWVALAFIVVIPFVLYYTGYIMKDWMNRSGIILNFIAGFMVAPDLIGEKRLVQLEALVETNSQRLMAIWQLRIYPYRKYISWEVFGILLFLYASYYFIYKVHAGESLLHVTLMLYIFDVGYMVIRKVRRLKPFTWTGFGKTIIESQLIFLKIMIGTPLIIFFYIFSWPFQQTLVFILNRLAGDNKLKSILVWWGIVFFIMGNLMQLIATF